MLKFLHPPQSDDFDAIDDEVRVKFSYVDVTTALSIYDICYQIALHISCFVYTSHFWPFQIFKCGACAYVYELSI